MPDIETGRLIYLILLVADGCGLVLYAKPSGVNKNAPRQVASLGHDFIGVQRDTGLGAISAASGDIRRQSYQAGTAASTLPAPRATVIYYLTATIQMATAAALLLWNTRANRLWCAPQGCRGRRGL